MPGLSDLQDKGPGTRNALYRNMANTIHQWVVQCHHTILPWLWEVASAPSSNPSWKWTSSILVLQEVHLLDLANLGVQQVYLNEVLNVSTGFV